MHSIGRFFVRDRFAPVAAAVMLIVWVLLCYVIGCAEWMLAPMLALLPAVALMLPVYLCYCTARAGRIPAFACILLAGLIGLYTGGWAVAGCVLLVLLVPVLLVLVLQDRRLDFWHSVGWAIGTVFAVGMAVVCIAWALVGGDLILALRNLLEQRLNASPYADQYLYTCYQAGLLSLPEGMEPVLHIGSFYWLNPPARQQLMRGLLFLFETSMRYQLPVQLVSASILSGVLCVALPRRVQRRRMEDAKEAPMPPFASWVLPKRMGKILAVSLLVAGILMVMGSAGAFYSAFATVWAGLRQVMMLLGASTLYFLMKKNGSMGRAGRMAAIVAIAAFLGGLLWIIGCLDQFLDLRRPRISVDRNEGEDDK